MDGPSVEHSDSDSGESWTLLENNSVYADEPPEFIDDRENRQGAHHEKDEDTDGISIISDSDHDTPSPQPGDTIHDKCQMQENHLTENDISEFVSVAPHLSNIDNDEPEPALSEDFLGDSHAKHKTYVHKRNKRLSTVLNIIVLGSVITAAGVAIGHMWGAKYDCTVPPTPSVNKILSNLYKLQEENAYLRNKLKELTFSNNNNNIQHHKLPLKYNKCKKVFEESLSNNEPKKLTKCVDENYNNADFLMDHLTKPKFEKEFIADIDKLKTVYLQNKSWLDDEISRRMKIEEELLKKYNNEVNSAKQQKKTESTDEAFKSKNDQKKETLQSDDQNYVDSLQPEHKPRFKRNEDQYATVDNNVWVTTKQYESNNFDHGKDREIKQSDHQSKQNQDAKPDLNEDVCATKYDSNLSESAQKISSNVEEHDDDWIEVKPKLRHIEERHHTDPANSFIEQETIINWKEQETPDKHLSEEIHKFRRNEYDDHWSKNKQETKKMRKKERRDTEKNAYKQNSDAKKNKSDEERILEYSMSPDDFIKDDRYINNKLKKEKKRNTHPNYNKKQKRRNKNEKLNMKGEYGEKFESVVIPEDYVLNQFDKQRNLDPEYFIKNADDFSKFPVNYNDLKDKYGKVLDKEGRKDNKEEEANWFEKRAALRTEARKKYYEQFRETSPNNSSWYFRRMRKREQCRAKGDNNTFRKIQKEKRNHGMKY